jgi:hypothetical protein
MLTRCENPPRRVGASVGMAPDFNFIDCADRKRATWLCEKVYCDYLPRSSGVRPVSFSHRAC